MATIPILHDCAAGIADVQVRNRRYRRFCGRGGPVRRLGPVLLALSTEVHAVGPKGSRKIALPDFFKDAYTTALAGAELLSQVVVQVPPPKSGGAYVAFKRSAPVYASASAAVQLNMSDRDTCAQARVFLGCVGLLPVRAQTAESRLEGQPVSDASIEAAAEAAMQAAEPQSDMRGSAEYKKVLVKHLVKRAIEIALRRSRGEQVGVT